MSLLEQIRNSRKNLKPCLTNETTPDGKVFVKKFEPDGTSSILQENAASLGYVVDYKPDLQVAKIIEGLCMSSQDPTQDISILSSFGISHVLSVGVDVPKVSEAIIYKFVPMFDLPEEDFGQVFECVSFIDGARKEGGVVLVHCNAGISRSAAVVTAYLMTQGYSFTEALSKVKDKRSCANPNKGFIEKLKLLENKLKHFFSQ